MSSPFPVEDNDQTRARREHLEQIRDLVGNAYPNQFRRTGLTETPEGEDTITSVLDAFKAHVPQAPEGEERPSPEQLESANSELNKFKVRISGRIATPPRVMGKAAFVHLSDGRERLQIYVRKQDARAVSNDSMQPVEEVDSGWKLFGLLDHGDFLGVEGELFVTKTGELSVHVREMQFLSKALLPMPDKVHGIADPEIRQRQRYADLIASSLKVEREPGEMTTREVFERRSKLVNALRRHLDEHGYIEVETPMLSPVASGAAAKPFVTHHNALDIDLYLRIAPELYLKRLLVGGFERVYELNRNFRNEGISTRHNPEFTMLEFYTAYKDVNWMMDFCEEMLRRTIAATAGATALTFGETELDFGRPFRRLTMKEAIAEHAPEGTKNVAEDELEARRIVELFEQHAEHKLLQPTFITDFPKPVSPLSKASPDDPTVAERFELYVMGMEVANGFSELNDPVEQYERFEEQTRQREGGDEEAMQMDVDYVRALSYGMPPAAGIGIGIDRLTMLLTNRRSIRDVILFPHMRPQRAKADDESEGGEAAADAPTA
ncbi:MAG TPA: lysine--tRNA ligase [Pyrinomonadaceae bacterium]|jgi:lysyl-tRNA synthetase class 2|nr:lysine--tRNA ligase [Pyrinomonadaceae bacterium]